jgi:hypothetical protein
MRISSFCALSHFWTFWQGITKRRESLRQPDEFPSDDYAMLLAAAAHVGEGSVMVAHALERVQSHRS